VQTGTVPLTGAASKGLCHRHGKQPGPVTRRDVVPGALIKVGGACGDVSCRVVRRLVTSAAEVVAQLVTWVALAEAELVTSLAGALTLLVTSAAGAVVGVLTWARRAP